MLNGIGFDSDFPILRSPFEIEAFFQRAASFVEKPPGIVTGEIGPALGRVVSFDALVGEVREEEAVSRVLARLVLDATAADLPHAVVFPIGWVALLRHPDDRPASDAPLRISVCPFEPADADTVRDTLARLLLGLADLVGDQADLPAIADDWPARLPRPKVLKQAAGDLLAERQARIGGPARRTHSSVVDDDLDWLARNRPTLAPAQAAGARGDRGRAHVAGARDATAPDMRLHVINTRFGKLSLDGGGQTSPSDVEAIAKAARDWSKGHARPLVVYAHGGLVDKASAAAYARQTAAWWLENGCYPIFCIWESGAFETLMQLVAEVFRGTGRGGFDLDELRDLAIEQIVRRTATTIWDGMKRSAEAASAPGPEQGLARLVAELKKTFGDKLPPIHLVGHSAGSILHLHFLALLRDEGLAVESFQALAPAATVSLYRKTLAALPKAPPCRIYAMTDAAERDDTASVYGKSLLYLVRQGFEPETTPIAGLQRDLAADPAFVKRLASGNGGLMRETLIFSPTPEGTPRRYRTQARRHGDFDNDRDTMWSTLRFIRSDADEDDLTRFPDLAAGSVGRALAADGLPEELRTYLRLAAASAALSAATAPATAVASATAAGALPAAARAPSRRALTIGIDDYPGRPLQGCVNDSRAWSEMLGQRGFQVESLASPSSTDRAQVIARLRGFLAAAGTDDTLVWHFSGHGTQLELDTGADDDFESSLYDQAIVAGGGRDFESAAIRDDELFAIIRDELHADARLFVFLDSCFSGSATRLYGTPRRLPPIRRRDYVPRKLALVPARGGTRGDSAYTGVNHVLFSACTDQQVAIENEVDGETRGVFTTAVKRLLASNSGGFTCTEFETRIAKHVAGSAQQPRVFCDASRDDWPFPLTA